VQHTIHFGGLFEEWSGLIRVEESQPDREFQVAFDFRERPQRYGDVVGIRAASPAIVTFCNVRWNRSGRSADLGDKLIPLVSRHGSAQSVGGFCEGD